MKVDYGLYLILDDIICPPENMIFVISKLVDLGVTCVQLRMKSSSAETIGSIGKSLLEILRPQKIPLIINDHIEIVKKLNADGLHIGQRDIEYYRAREYLGYTKIIGLSIDNIDQAKKAQHYDVDYFGVGPVFPTLTKQDTPHPIGIFQLDKITNIFSKPVVAIGGINLKNIKSVLKSGVSGVAVSSAILASHNPVSALKKLAKIINLYREIK